MQNNKKNNKNIINIKKINLLNMNRNNLYDFFIKLGEKKFHVHQLMKWIYYHYKNNFNDMTDMKKTLRDKLKLITIIKYPKLINEKISIDGTIKWVFGFNKQNIETVYIPEVNRSTLCISSQIGCLLKCTFCATGKQGFNRNLKVSEIIGQVLYAFKIIKNKFNKKNIITNIVIMGMGEPLLNTLNVIKSIEIMLDNFGFGISKKKITISTSGIVPSFLKLLNSVDVLLAISLHASNDFIRNKIMPINKKYNISMILNESKLYLKKSRSNKYITIEYIMLKSINDKILYAYELSSLLNKKLYKINLIFFNYFKNTYYKSSSYNVVYKFYKILINNGFIVTIRKIRGIDIEAACGQLVGLVNNKNKYK